MKRIYISRIVLLIALLSGLNWSATAQTSTYSTAGAYVYTVPAGCTNITATVCGAAGGTGWVGGGKGGCVTAALTVTSGQQLYVNVGGVGGNSGGAGGSSTGGESGGAGGTSNGGAGGGAGSDIRTISGNLASRVLVGGGGGGDAYTCSPQYTGGAGGYPAGGNGTGSCASAGTGGSQTGPGSAGGSYNGYTPVAGALGTGGTGYYYGGGGGGGYYGGGGSADGSGGGGSSTAQTVGVNVPSNITYANGTQSGAGSVAITPLLPTANATPSSLSFGSVAVGATSAPALFSSINGNYMTAGPLTATISGAPAGVFQVQNGSGTWSNTSVTLAYTPPSVSGLNVYVQFTPAAVIPYSGTLTITGGGLVTPITIPLSGSGATACTGTPTAGTATVSPASGGAYTVFTLSLSGVSGAGFTYQWQKSGSASGPWINIPGAVIPTYTFTGIPSTTYFRCIVTCAASGIAVASGASAGVTYAPVAGASCTGTTAATGYSSGLTLGSVTNPFTVVGISTMVDNFVNAGGSTSRYTDLTTTQTVQAIAGSTMTASYGVNEPTGTSLQVWADFNDNGSFDLTPVSEIIGGYNFLPSFSGSAVTTTLTIPAGVLPGPHRMRVIMTSALSSSSSSTYPTYPSIPACPSSTVNFFDSRDYTLLILPPNCAGTPSAGITSATPTSACAAPFSPTIFNVGQSALSGITYNWQSSPDGTSWTNVGGATSAAYTPTLNTPGTVYYRNRVACAFGGTAFSTPTAVSLNQPPTPITGNFNLCTGVGSTLTSTTTEPGVGTWSSSATGIVTTDGTTDGIVTGASVGLATITFTAPSGCFATQQVTVNAQPAAISGPSTVCAGSTITYSDPTPAGTWTSLVPSVLTVGATSGIATAPLSGSGTTSLCYTSSLGCSSCMPVTVNPLPTQYVTQLTPGSSATYCAGSPSTANIRSSGSEVGVTYQLLLNGSPVGPPLAGTSGAIAFGIQTTPGNYTIIGTNNTTGCSRQMVASVTVSVNPLPGIFTICGGGSYCAGDFGSAPHIMTCDGSQPGVSYTLWTGGVPSYTSSSTTGSNLDFGVVPTAGDYIGIATNSTTGCKATMTGGATITINPLPDNSFNITPTGAAGYCTGGPGVDVALDFSTSGISYQLFNGATPVATLAGIGGRLNFGYKNIDGTYTIVGTNVVTGCHAPMSGATTIFENLPPPVHTLTTAAGGASGSYCATGTGVELVLDGSDGSVNYQLYKGITAVGSPVGGTSGTITFGMVTDSGTYNVVATDASTSCTNNMLGTATIHINPLPALETVTGGGNFCAGGTGVVVRLSPSVAGTSYQLIYGTTPLPVIVAGTGGNISFGNVTGAGTYGVQATITATGCQRTMAGVATVAVNPLPDTFHVTGTGNYCAGGTGRTVGLNVSATGVTYQLYKNGTATGVPVTGTGSSITFGSETDSAVYTVKGTNTSTSCVNTMAGNAVVGILPTPAPHLVTGGGNFCAGDTGRHVGINGSQIGVTYTLLQGLTPMGDSAGTGSIIDFGLQTVGGTYTVLATDGTTGCTKYMTGGAPINVYALPDAYTVSGGGVYCAGGSGVHIGLTGSASGIRYQLMTSGGSPVGLAVNGTGGAIDFGMQNIPGTYSVMAINNTTNCNSNMLGSVTVATTALPTVFTVGGGGSYCAGGTGVAVTLDGAETGISYQLYKGTATAGAAMTGSGPLTFSALTDAGAYTVVATNPITGCRMNMAGSASIAINPLPAVFPVTGGGAYCAGGAGYHIYLSGSNSGISYQLMNGSATAGLPATGSGSAVDFGVYTDAGTYTAMATDPATTCTSTMTGSTNITINPLPDAHTVTGGGNYCLGGTGVNVGLATTNTGISYQLVLGGTATGTGIPGTGSNINFGLQTAAGSYSVKAVNTTTGCISDMTGAVNVNTIPLPVVYGITGGGSYCETGLGVAVGLSASDLSVNYQLWNGSTAVGVPMSGTGGSINFGPETVPGNYTVRATDAIAGCMSNMSGTATISVIPVVLPHVDLGASIAGTVCIGQTVTYTANPVNGGSTPTYQWMVNGVTVGVGNTYSYIPVDGDKVTALVHSNATCAIPDTGSGSMIVTVSPPEMPVAAVTANPGAQVCTGATATFTVHTLFGGTTPTYDWIVNSGVVGHGATYSYVPMNGDIVKFRLTSNFACRLADVVYSNNTTMDVEPAQLPVVTLTSDGGSAPRLGQSITFTASVTHGGSAPTYQWIVNSASVPGATSRSFTSSSLVNGDSVTCVVEGTCGLSGFNSIKVRIGGNGVSVAQVNGAGNNLVLVPNPNKGDFTVKGTLASATDEDVTLEVTNMVGQVVYTNKVTAVAGSIDQHIHLDNLANGMYLLNLHSGSENTVFHFVIEQ